MNVQGPRPIRREEVPSLGRLLNAVFRSNTSRDILKEFPQLFNDRNLEHLMVIVEGGEVVTHVGMVVRPISFEGPTLTMGLVGAVGTTERCRGRGYATRCLDALLDKAAREGVDLAWISGERGLYTSRGAARVGRQWVHTVGPGDLPEGLRLGEMTSGDLAAAAVLYRNERVHFVRSRDDWVRAFDNQFVMDRKARFWCVWRRDRLSAYLVVHERQPARGAPLLAEFAGDRPDAAIALPAAVQRMRLEKVEVRVSDSDEDAREAFGRVAITEARIQSGYGVVLPMRLAGCMERLTPRIAEYCGEHVAHEVRFSESREGPGSRAGKDDRLTMTIGNQHAHILRRAEVAKFLFGTPEGVTPAFEGAASVVVALRPAFPLPTPWYGLNYV